MRPAEPVWSCWFTRTASGLAILVGLLRFVAGQPIGRDVVHGSVPGLAVPGTCSALALVAAGIALCLARNAVVSPPVAWARRLCALVVVVLSLVPSTPLILGLPPVAAETFAQLNAVPASTGTGAVPAPMPDLAVLLIGLALISLDSSIVLAEGLGLTAGALALIAVASPFDQVPAFREINAPLDAATSLVLGLGVLAARPRRGLLRLLTSEGLAGAVSRRLLPVALLPLLLGLVALIAERQGVLTPGVAEMVLAVGSAGALVAVTAAIATSLEHVDQVRQLTLLLERSLRRRLDALLAASQTLAEEMAEAAEIDLDRLCRLIATQARSLTDADYAAVGVGSDPSQPLQPWASVGLSPEQAAAIGRSPRAVGLLAALIQEAQTIRLADLTTDPRFRGFPPGHPELRSFLGVPIRYRGRTLGTLVLSNGSAAEFTLEDQRLIELLAAQAGALLEDARLRTAIAAERTRLQSVLAVAPVGLIVVEAGSDRVESNPAASRLVGCSLVPEAGRAQYAGRVLSPTGQPLPSEALPSSRALRGETVEGEDLLVEQPSGRRLPVRAAAAPLRDARGQVSGAVVAFADASAQQDLERERSVWTSIIAHDLRQPVTIILGYSDLLARRLQGSGHPESERAAEHIRAAARNLSRMVADLTDVSQLEAGGLTLAQELVELGPLVRDIVARLATLTEGHPVAVTVAAEPLPVSVDRGRLEQVVGNLLSNAAKYGEPASPIVVTVTRDNENAHLAVTNHGEGIPPEEQPRLFERFYRTPAARAARKPGSGLGLFITKGLVEAHGGRIWVESIPNQTTTFHVVLPLQASER